MSSGSGNNNNSNKYIPNNSSSNGRGDYNYHHNNQRGYYRGNNKQHNGYYGGGRYGGGPTNGGGSANFPPRYSNSPNENNSRMQRQGSHGNGAKPYGYGSHNGNPKPQSHGHLSQHHLPPSSSSSSLPRGNNRRDESPNRREESPLPLSSINDIKIQKRTHITEATNPVSSIPPSRQKSASNLLDIKIEKRRSTSTTDTPKLSNGNAHSTKRKSVDISADSASPSSSTSEARRKSVDTGSNSSNSLLDKDKTRLTSISSSSLNSIKIEKRPKVEDVPREEKPEEKNEVGVSSRREEGEQEQKEEKEEDETEEKKIKLKTTVHDDERNESEESTDEESSIPAPTKRTRKLMRLMRKATSDSEDDEEEGGHSEVITMDEDEDDKEERLNIRKRKQRTVSASSRSQSPNGHKRKLSGKTGKDASGRSLLQRICAKGNFEDAEELIKSGVNVNEADYAGNTPLHEAALEGYTDIVELLLDHGAVIDTKSGHMDRDTALIDAAANHHLDVVRLLIKRGADPTLVNAHGDNALDSVDGDRDSNEFDDDELNDMRKIKKLLVQAIKEFKKKSKSKLSQKDDTDPLSKVQNQNAFYDLITKEGRSEIVIKVAENDETFVLNYVSNLAGSKIPPELLTIAAKHGHTEIASLLIAFGAKINYADKQGMTPLMHAVGKDHLNMVKLLLENNANPNLRDKQERTALDIINESDIGADEEEIRLITAASEKASGKSSKKSSSNSTSSKSKKASRGKKRRVETDESDVDDAMGEDTEPEKPVHETKKKQKTSIDLDSTKPANEPEQIPKPQEKSEKKEAIEAAVKETQTVPPKEKEKPKVVVPPPLTEEEIAARKAKELEMQKAREALEAQKLITKKARKLQILENLAQLENKRKEEKREAELQELEKKKREEEEIARKAKEADELARQEIIRQDITRRKMIRSFYPIGLQNAKFNAPPSYQVASKYLPLYTVEVNGDNLCVDVQVNLLLGVEDLYGSFPKWEKRLMSNAEKSRMWNFFWPMIGSLSVLENLSPSEAKQLYTSEESTFQDLVLHWVKLDDVMSTMKDDVYIETYNAFKECGFCKVSIETNSTITSQEPQQGSPSLNGSASVTSPTSYTSGLSLPMVLRSRLSPENVPSKTKLW